MNVSPTIERLPLLATSPVHTFTGGHMKGMLTGSAKAETPFGPLTGRTPIHVTDFGTDSALISFMCGPTPVQIAVADSNFHGLIRSLIALAAEDTRQQLEDELADALEQVAS